MTALQRKRKGAESTIISHPPCTVLLLPHYHRGKEAILSDTCRHHHAKKLPKPFQQQFPAFLPPTLFPSKAREMKFDLENLSYFPFRYIYTNDK